jgi:diguanylate cyclase (GGDEF)-like protein
MTRDLIDVRSLPLFPLLELAFDGLALVVPSPWRLAYVNPALAEWMGASAAERIGRPVEEWLRGGCNLPLADLLDAALSRQQQEETLSAELLARHQVQIPVEIRVVRLVLNEDAVLGILIRKVADSQHDGALASADRRDPLTSLPDRAFLLARLESLIRRARTGDRPFAVLFVDLDNFKQINDAHGHLIGDSVVQEVARRLSACVRDGDCVVRYGGDEFVVIVDQVDGLEEVQPVINRVHAAMLEPISLPNGEAKLTASIGSAISSPTLRTPEELLMTADRDMYASKQSR